VVFDYLAEEGRQMVALKTLLDQTGKLVKTIVLAGRVGLKEVDGKESVVVVPKAWPLFAWRFVKQVNTCLS